jgi:hypothetical protein
VGACKEIYILIQIVNYKYFVFSCLYNMSYNDDEELKIGEFEEEVEDDLSEDTFDDLLDDDLSDPIEDDEEDDSIDKIADLEGSEL